LALIGLIFLLAVLTWKFIENPFRNKETISLNSIVVVILVYLLLFRVDFASIVFNEELAFKSNQEHQTSSSNQTLIDFQKNKTSNSSSIMPNEELFLFGRETSIGKRCYTNHALGSKTTKLELCRVHETSTSPPVYFILGDSLALGMLGVFKNFFEYPGMFAALNGDFGSPLCRSNIVFPSRKFVTPDGSFIHSQTGRENRKSKQKSRKSKKKPKNFGNQNK
jgi:hypothetical protein